MITRGLACLIFGAALAAAQDAVSERQETLLRVLSLAERFEQFEDKQLAAESLTTLGRVTCQ